MIFMNLVMKACKKAIALIKTYRLNIFRANTRIDPKCNLSNLQIRGTGKIELSKGVSFRSGCIINVAEGAELDIGEDCFFNDMCLINVHKRIAIGDRSIFGQGVYMYDHDHNYRSQEDMRGNFLTAETVIGKDTWIGSNVIILRGSKIGDRCVIGAGTVVKGDIPSDTMVYTDRKLVIKPLNREEH